MHRSFPVGLLAALAIAAGCGGRPSESPNGRAKSISVIDVATRKVTRTIDDVGARPWGIGISPDGTFLYTANGSSGGRLRRRRGERKGPAQDRHRRQSLGDLRSAIASAGV